MNHDNPCRYLAQVESLLGGWRTLDEYGASDEARAIQRIHDRCAVGFANEMTRVVAIYHDDTREVIYRKNTPPVDVPEHDDQFTWREQKET